MYLEPTGGVDRVAIMIWRNQNNGPEEEHRDAEPERRDPPRDEPRSAPPPAGNSTTAMSSVGERVETVLEAAERAAADIRRDAEQWAQRHMEETRRRADAVAAQRVQELSSITDDLLSRAQAVAKQSDELISALDSASRRAIKAPLRRQEDGASEDALEEAAAAPAPTPKAEPASEESAPAEAEHGAVAERRPVSDGARLLATQMAVAGSSRDTIASRLREEFGIDDPSAILDEAGL
jgi:hypothetical protein